MIFGEIPISPGFLYVFHGDSHEILCSGPN